jgi:hypothetical protein
VNVASVLLVRLRYTPFVPRPPVEPATPLTPAQKLELSLDMFVYGCEMMRQNLRRAHPGASDAAIEELLRAWLRTRPGAEHGDGVGRPVSWPRRGSPADA